VNILYRLSLISLTKSGSIILVYVVKWLVWFSETYTTWHQSNVVCIHSADSSRCTCWVFTVIRHSLLTPAGPTTRNSTHWRDMRSWPHITASHYAPTASGRFLKTFLCFRRTWCGRRHDKVSILFLHCFHALACPCMSRVNTIYWNAYQLDFHQTYGNESMHHRQRRTHQTWESKGQSSRSYRKQHFNLFIYHGNHTQGTKWVQ